MARNNMRCESDRDSKKNENVPQNDDCRSYQYYDYATVQVDNLTLGESIGLPPPSTRNASEASIRAQRFPVKLYAMLSQYEFHDIIAWNSHGRSWRLLKPTVFENLVMPFYFEQSTVYQSFCRLISAWSFRQVKSGPDRGSYYHEVR